MTPGSLKILIWFPNQFTRREMESNIKTFSLALFFPTAESI
jgi:hypothetical protein